MRKCEVWTSYTYDGAGRLKFERYDLKSDDKSQGTRYAYDEYGNRKYKTIHKGNKSNIDLFEKEYS